MDRNKRAIDPAVIISKCDEALEAAQHDISAFYVRIPGQKDYGALMRKIRAARDMIKRHGYGNE